MRHAIAVSVRRPSIPRGWTLLGLALASWAVVFVVSQVAGALFNYILASV